MRLETYLSFLEELKMYLSFLKELETYLSFLEGSLGLNSGREKSKIARSKVSYVYNLLH